MGKTSEALIKYRESSRVFQRMLRLIRIRDYDGACSPVPDDLPTCQEMLRGALHQLRELEGG